MDREDHLDHLMDECESAALKGRTLPLDLLCKGDSKLLADLKHRLAALDLMNRIMANQASHSEASDDTPTMSHDNYSPPLAAEMSSHPRPSVVGFKLERIIGQGGQGVVYEGVQKSTGRKVAIKILLSGADNHNSNLTRFEREFKVLASLNHPGIVGLIDRGATDSGAPYLVLHFVSGERLDQWASRIRESHNADSDKLLVRLLRLFVRVCAAVQVAHQRGIIHRDIKPSNVLVDANDQPHVLDFGLARPLFESHTSTDDLPVTQTGQFVGSLPWASPEQAEGNWENVDARTDVYAIGVMLYQALTGQFPYEVRSSLREVLNNIVMVWPSPPSQVAKSATGSLGINASFAPSRTELSLPPDLDHTVLRALHKSPSDRHADAGELGRELEEHLQRTLAGKQDVSHRKLGNANTVQKRNPSTNRKWISGSIVVLFLLVLVFEPWNWIAVPSLSSQNSLSPIADYDTIHEKNRLLLATGDPASAMQAWREMIPRLLASEAVSPLRKRAIVLDAVAGAKGLRDWRQSQIWLVAILDSLRTNEGDNTYSLIEPLIHLADVYESDGQPKEAEKRLADAASLIDGKGHDSPSELDREMLLLAERYSARGSKDLALFWSLRAVAHRFAHLNDDEHRDMAPCWNALERALMQKGLAAESQMVAAAAAPDLSSDARIDARFNRLRMAAKSLDGIALQGSIAAVAAREVCPLMRHAIRLYEDSKAPAQRNWIGHVWIEYATLLKLTGDVEAAMEAYRTAIPYRDKLVGGKDYWIRGVIGGRLFEIARYAEAEPYFSDSIQILEANPGLDEEHQQRLIARRLQLAAVYAHLMRWEESRLLFEPNLAALEPIPAAYDAALRTYGQLLLHAYTELGLEAKAEGLREKLESLSPAPPSSPPPSPQPKNSATISALIAALAASERRQPWPSAEVIKAEFALAEELNRMGQFDRAILHAARSTSGMLSTGQVDDVDSDLLPYWRLLASAYTGLKDEPSAKIIEQGIGLSDQNSSDANLTTRAVRLRLLGEQLNREKLHREAELPLQLAIQVAERTSQQDKAFIADLWFSLASTHKELGAYPRSVQAFEKAIAIRESFLIGEDAWGRNMLADVHYNHGNIDLAESGYRKVVQHKVVVAKNDPSPARLRDLNMNRLKWGDTLVLLKRFEEAREPLEQGIDRLELDIPLTSKQNIPAHIRALELYYPKLMATYRALGDHEKAQALEKRIQKLLSSH